MGMSAFYGSADEPEAIATIHRAIEIRDGMVHNPKILSFQSRSPTFPYPKQRT